MESGGPSAILGPLERLGQGRARNGKARPAREQKKQNPGESLEPEDQERELGAEPQDSENRIDIRI